MPSQYLYISISILRRQRKMETPLSNGKSSPFFMWFRIYEDKLVIFRKLYYFITAFQNSHPVPPFPVLNNCRQLLYYFNKTFRHVFRLDNVRLDVAIPDPGQRGDESSWYPPAVGLEECSCPSGYSGLSCQVRKCR